MPAFVPSGLNMLGAVYYVNPRPHLKGNESLTNPGLNSHMTGAEFIELVKVLLYLQYSLGQILFYFSTQASNQNHGDSLMHPELAVKFPFRAVGFTFQ